MWFSLTFPVCSKFPDFSLTGKCLPIFPGFPVRVGTLTHGPPATPPAKLRFRSVITAHKRSLWRLCFYRCLSVHKGGGSMCGGGTACVVGGHAWQGRGVHGRGACVAGVGACVAGVGACMAWGIYYVIRSMSGRYASYWNAFLLSG